MSFTCPRCDMTSHHPMDEDYGYCGNCHAFTGTPKKAPTPTSEAELQFWFDIHQASDQMALAQWRAAHPTASDQHIPEHADLVIWLLDQLAGLNRVERTESGLIDWKMEAERANRLLDSYERKYSTQAIATAESEAFERGYQSAERQIADVRAQLDLAKRGHRVDVSLAKRVGDHIQQTAAFKVWLTDWLRCYATDIFPEPDLKKAADVLKANDMTIDQLSAEMGRHILTRVIARFDNPEEP